MFPQHPPSSTFEHGNITLQTRHLLWLPNRIKLAQSYGVCVLPLHKFVWLRHCPPLERDGIHFYPRHRRRRRCCDTRTLCFASSFFYRVRLCLPVVRVASFAVPKEWSRNWWTAELHCLGKDRTIQQKKSQDVPVTSMQKRAISKITMI